MVFEKLKSLFAAGVALVAHDAFASTPDAAGIEFFESKVRPILVDNCYRCHSREAGKNRGGLQLDTRDAMLKGGDSGPALIPGQVDKSLFIKAVRYTDENLLMPPKGKKLLPEQIAALEEWVKMGAPDPRETPKTGTLAEAANQGIDDKAKVHWAFQTIKNPPAPEIKTKRWAKSPVDHFIAAKLEAKQMKPSPQADKRTLIRRATFDLTGLPPTPEDVDAFEKDRSSNAFARVIDRLLASPRYGERWGRHWLDVARYADTKGYMFEEERRYPYAFTYRDYVVRAFNEDLPYDQFITQQLAADQLELGEDKRPLAAMGFLTVGRRFLNNQNDIIDDRIDVTCRGLMGLTVACARCHDHKYDPIPTKDYYSLYGVFSSSREPDEKPLLGIIPPKYDEYLAEKKRREEDLEKYKVDRQNDALAGLRKRVGDYLLAAHDLPLITEQTKKDAFLLDRKLDNGVVQRWISGLESWGKTNHPVFVPWLAFAALSEGDFAGKAKELSATFAANQNKEKPVHPLVAPLFTNAPASLKELADAYGKLFNEVDKRWVDALEAARKANAAAPTALAEPPWEELRQLLYANEAPANLPRPELERFYPVEVGQTVRAKIRDIEGLAATHIGAPPRAMSMEDKSNPHNVHVFIRGNAGNPGPEVPRQFLQILSGPERKPFEKGSGRLELARAIASTNNPLTARVIVNRVWMHHFGKGFVTTPSDFGLRSEPPVHLELLDWLSWDFMKNGWSLKRLHRQIMLSAVYQQTSDQNDDYVKLDPNNQLFWKMNRQRLEFEALRDSLLVVAGKLEETMGGRAVDIVQAPFSGRRSIYGHIDRQNLPGLFRTFDFANPDSTSPQRFFTTVPQQALFLLNSPFVVQQAGYVLTNLNQQKLKRDKDKVEFLYRNLFQRAPAREEVRVAEQFIDKQISIGSLPPNQSAWRYGYGNFDEKTKRVTSFTPLPHFAPEQRWQNSAEFPDPQLAYTMLTREGGHPGNRDHQAVIRRWISPFDGTVTIGGELFHFMEGGDGVRGRAVSSRHGKVAEWIAHNKKVETTVQTCDVRRGDFIDFVVDARGGPSHDTFKWAPVLKVAAVKYGTPPPAKSDWNATRDFDGPTPDTRPMTAWEKYAQALLLSNEFVFID